MADRQDGPHILAAQRRPVATIDTLEARWPSGKTPFLGPFTGDRKLRVYEDGQVAGVEPDSVKPSRPLLQASVPNPFLGLASIRFSLPQPAAVTLSVYDVAGRCVRTLRNGSEMPAGLSTVTWDGRDDGGVPGALLHVLLSAAGPGLRTVRHA